LPRSTTGTGRSSTPCCSRRDAARRPPTWCRAPETMRNSGNRSCSLAGVVRAVPATSVNGRSASAVLKVRRGSVPRAPGPG
jgi:hypothetical protein